MVQLLNPLNYTLDPKSYPPDNLTEKQNVIVKGKTGFSRLSRVLDGKELADNVANARARNMRNPLNRPHTSLQIQDPIFVITGDEPTYNDWAMMARAYVGKSGKYAGKSLFSLNNPGYQLPNVFVINPETKAYEQILLEGEPDAGLDVTVIINIYKPKDYEKRGWGIQGVYFNEPIRYYQNAGVSDSILNALGIHVDGPVRNYTNDDAIAAGVVAAGEEEAMAHVTDVVTDDGFVMPSPQVNTPAPQPVVQQPVQAAPAPQPVVQQPVIPTPAPAPAMQTPAPATQPEMTPEQRDIKNQQTIAEMEAKLAALQAAKNNATAETSAFTNSQPTAETPLTQDPWNQSAAGIPLPTSN